MSFVVDILAFFWLRLWDYFFKNLAFFF